MRELIKGKQQVFLTKGWPLDLRHISLILLAYFGGFIPAFIAVAVISVGRFFIDINFSSTVSFLMVFTMTIGAGFIAKNVKVEAWKK